MIGLASCDDPPRACHDRCNRRLLAVGRTAGGPSAQKGGSTEGEEHARPQAPPSLTLISRLFGSLGPAEPSATELRSYAVERSAEPSGTQPSEPVLDLLEQLAALDDALLDLLALLPGEGDDYRFAESRVAKFIGGRVEDRLSQVRDIRGTQKPPPSGRMLHIRDQAGKRMISIR